MRMILALAAALALLPREAFCAESYSASYSNLSLNGAVVTPAPAAAPAAALPAPRAAQKRRATTATKAKPVVIAPTIAAPIRPRELPQPRDRGNAWPWLAAILALTAGGYVLRRQNKRRQADDETIALAAHELQSPLAAIESYLELMASESPEGTKDMRLWLEDVRHMKSTTSHLRRTIGDILDMTRVEDGRMKLTLRPVDLSALAAEAVTSFGAHASARGIKLLLSTSAAKASASADPDRVRQVLDNLLGNALKYTPSGKSVTIATHVEGDSVKTEVIDEGAGVPPAKRDKLFGKFARLSPTVDGTEGTGLGLYLSRRLIEAQNGQLEYRPNEKGGSVFSFRLPTAGT